MSNQIITTLIDGGNIIGKISGLSTQTLETMVKDIDSRVDTIITTPVEGVSAQEIIDARQGEGSLGANITEVKSQLAQKAKQVDYFLGSTVRSDQKVKNGLITFHSDDASLSDWTVLRPLIQSKGIPFCTAVVKNLVGTANYCDMTQIKSLQDHYGWEILSHSVTHSDTITSMSDADSEAEFRDSKEFLFSNGLNVESFAYPFGYFADREKEYARKYYRSARSYEFGLNGLNTSPIETYELKVTLFGTGSMVNPSGLPLGELDTYKYYIDKAVEENAWLIITCHSWSIENNNLQELFAQVIDYAKLKSNVVSNKQALDIIGNTLDVGNTSKTEPYKNHFAVGYDGKTHTNNMETVYKEDNFSDGITSIDKFEDFKVTVNRVFGVEALASGLPDPAGGILYTYKYATWDDINQFFSYQVLHGLTNGDIYKRKLKQDKTWGDWKDYIKKLFLDNSVNTKTCNTPIVEFPLGVSFNKIDSTTAAVTGSPEGKGGTLITHKVDASPTAYNWQEYKIYATNKKYHRKYGDGVPQEWIIDNRTLNLASVAPNTLVAGATYEHTIIDATIKIDNMAIVNPKGTMPPGIVWNTQCKDGSIIIRVTNATSASIAVPNYWWAVNVLGIIK